ncbi:MAG: CRISPR-associated endonuclease/helicase Cas3 [Candidatus Hydrogenedentes bacterium ADurb.Bin101]|nr:MAG: CRISPR-associated endonuclease/helicase Cas3 [Candidatus Hydrogenedentes bacterium ADurb.Bin101]
MWAKTDNNNTAGFYHPLLCHLLDVAAVAATYWDECPDSTVRRKLEASLGRDARSRVLFFTGAHDIGKASPFFQNRVPEIAGNTGLPFPRNALSRPHGFISTKVLRDVLSCNRNLRLLSRITGGHHGVFPRAMNLEMGADTLGNNDWDRARREILDEFAQTVGFDLNQCNRDVPEISDAALVPILAGFISVVDWIGSNQDFFPCESQCGCPLPYTTAEYWELARKRSKSALETLGWLPAVSFTTEAAFDRVFRGFTPNALQSTALSLASLQTGPYLMIIEAPMGKGKTEAALYGADLAFCRGYARGLYIAMPTQATGNAMFKRVLEDYLRHRGHQGRLNLQLVHGDALLAQAAEVPEGELAEFTPRDIDGGNGADVEAHSWFTAKKRPLLAPFGVGTIDQSLLSVLQTKHWFVRLFGLAGKVVIFDEVHAYDAYMGTILERLLQWLAEADCTVILLSATLPEAKRQALVRAYSGREDGDTKPYPRITLAHPRHYPDEMAAAPPQCMSIDPEQSHQVALHFCGTGLETLGSLLAAKLESGGCAAVICNTVNRAIEVFSYFRENLKGTKCLLFHARTLKRQRREREEEVLKKFGKGKKQPDGNCVNEHRPHRAVLVATQIIEQSLDLDFDFMVSEVAPIDLLLQRTGRLHRHTRKRPAGLATPELAVLCNGNLEGPPPESFGRSLEYVYDRYVLLRTWQAIRGLDHIEVPTEIEALVEAVYGATEQTCGEAWDTALHEARTVMDSERQQAEAAAGNLVVCPPDDTAELIEAFNIQLADDEDPNVHKQVRAATRQGDPSMTVVFLPESETPDIVSDVATARRLLDQSAKLSQRQLFRILLEEGQCPAEWRRNAHLRHARLVQLDGQNRGRVGAYVLTVDEQLGIVIEQEGENDV